MTDILEKVNDFLKEEKWTRTSIAEFSTNMLKQYDEYIEKIHTGGSSSEVESFLDGYLKTNPNSITALYFLGMLHVANKNIEGSESAKKLIDIFEENHRVAVTKYLCEKILEKVDFYQPVITKYIQILEDEKKPEADIIPYMELLVKIDYSDTKIGKKLAGYFEKAGQREKAILFYKKVFDYSLNRKNPPEVEELWKKLLEFEEIDYDYFFFKLNATENINLKIKLGEKLLDHFEAKEEWPLVVRIIKLIYGYLPDKTKVQIVQKLRDKIIEAYLKIYSANSQLDACVRRSNISQKWKNLAAAIAEFEKYIPFDKNKYVHHNQSGLGYIKEIHEDYLIVDFDKKKGHRMSIDMALKALKILEDGDFLVQKRLKPESLKKLVKENPVELVKLVMKQYDGVSTTKDIKEALAGDIVPEAQWNSFWDDVRGKMKNDPFITRTNTIYRLREKAASIEEGVLESFKETENLIDKARIFEEYLKNGGDPQSDIAINMTRTFQAYIRDDLSIHQNLIIAYFFLRDLKAAYPKLKIDLLFTSEELFRRMKEENSYVFNFGESSYVKKFFTELMHFIPEWHDIMGEYLTRYPSKFILNMLISKSYKDLILQRIKDINRNFRDKIDVFLWFCKNVFFNDDYANLSVEKADILVLLFTLYDFVNKARLQKIDVSENRKYMNAVADIIFRDKNLEKYLQKKPDRAVVQKMASIFFKIKEKSQEYDVEFRTLLARYIPEVLTALNVKETDESEGKFYSSEKSIKEKQEYMTELYKSTIPTIQQEMMSAKEKGDLRENAEYQSAREKYQSLNTELLELRKQLSNAQPIVPTQIKTDKVSIGSRITLCNTENDETIAYSILGKWDIDIDKNVISYETDLGKLLLNRKKGEIFENPGNGKKYKIMNIEKAL